MKEVFKPIETDVQMSDTISPEFLQACIGERQPTAVEQIILDYETASKKPPSETNNFWGVVGRYDAIIGKYMSVAFVAKCPWAIEDDRKRTIWSVGLGDNGIDQSIVPYLCLARDYMLNHLALQQIKLTSNNVNQVFIDVPAGVDNGVKSVEALYDLAAHMQKLNMAGVQPESFSQEVFAFFKSDIVNSQVIKRIPLQC
jgi:hypothetical protein